MRISFNLRFVKPSEIVAAIETGVVGSVEFVGNVARASRVEVRERIRLAKLEVAARRVLKEDMAFETMSYAERDQLMRDEAEIMARAIEIKLARAKRDAA